MDAVDCPSCGHHGPPAREFSDQGLVNCGACGHLFAPRKSAPAPSAARTTVRNLRPGERRSLSLQVWLHLLLGGRMTQWGFLFLWLAMVAMAVCSPMRRDFGWAGEVTIVAGLAMLLAGAQVLIGALSCLGVVLALRGYPVVRAESLEVVDTGLRLGGRRRMGGGQSGGSPVYRVDVTYRDAGGELREASQTSLSRAVHRIPGEAAQVLHHPVETGNAWILGTYPGQLEIGEDGRVLSRDEPVVILIQPLLALLLGSYLLLG